MSKSEKKNPKGSARKPGSGGHPSFCGSCKMGHGYGIRGLGCDGMIHP